MHIPFTTLDVFTSTRYLGNPLAIIRPPTPNSLSQTQKLQIAKEFNLSEVVFLHLPEKESLDSNSNPKELKIDIFTADAEIPFAGHPTIGTAFYVRNYLGLRSVEALVTKAGRIPISFPDDGKGKTPTAQIPHNIHIHTQTFSFRHFTTAQEIQCPIISIVNGMSFILVHLPSLEDLERVQEIGNLNKDAYFVEFLDEGWRSGLCCTMFFVGTGWEGGRGMYRTRMFAGMEDPGTGSASCALGCWLGLKRVEGDVNGGGDGGIVKKFGFVQGVEMGRRNDIFVDVRMRSDGGAVEDVLLSGEAVKVMEGTLEV
ncbi:5fdba79c-8a09-43be-b991-2d87c62067a4 [Sclerotinia trifoliorum]|uniref:5fdba79c-8a09-43be-b991-2d87c62067a4 n=1 Tax=Sclerotinia trifoliorum TaxID=28548 RepID=A0A8H2VQX4_9HELO|nr:5fdba79c-8a09-43be-b991-2d87c62067a4 [Sclerotinia trifoliorum]